MFKDDLLLLRERLMAPAQLSKKTFKTPTVESKPGIMVASFISANYKELEPNKWIDFLNLLIELVELFTRYFIVDNKIKVPANFLSWYSILKEVRDLGKKFIELFKSNTNG